MDRVNHCRAERTDWSGWRASLVATAAKLGGAYHKSIGLDLWIWLPGFGYYLWLNRVIWLGTEFGTPAGQMRGLLWFVCRSAGLWASILILANWPEFRRFSRSLDAHGRNWGNVSEMLYCAGERFG